MSAKTNIWLATASALALLAGPALAQTTTNDANVTIVNPDGPAEQAGEAIDNAAGATVDATQDAAQATGAAAQDATQATGEALENTGEAMQDTADTTTTVVPVQPATTLETAQPADTGMTTTDTQEVADGTPVEGQIFEQSPNTFLASTLLDGSVINPANENIGNVNDLVMTADGMVTGVVIGVGGFLGLGQKNVAIEMDRIDITEDENGRFAFQLNVTREELDAAPEFRTRDDIEAEQAATAAGAGTGGMGGGTGGMVGGGMSDATATPPATAAQ